MELSCKLPPKHFIWIETTPFYFFYSKLTGQNQSLQNDYDSVLIS